MKRRTKILLGVLAVAVVLFVLSRTVVMFTLVAGESMSPTLHTGDGCLGLRVHPYQPRRGDIVTFRTSDDPPLIFIKRVAGLPGETLAVEHGVLKINSQPVAYPFVRVNPDWEIPATLVPADKVYVLADNRTDLPEDYVQGPVAVRLVQSRVLWHWRWKP